MRFHFSRKQSSLRIYVLSMIATCVLVAGQIVRSAGQTSLTETKYDQTLLPISAVELKQALQNYSNDPTRIYQLVLRAEKQGKANVAYETLKDLRDKQPKNAVAFAGYCLAYDVYEGKYSGPYGAAHTFSPAEQEDYRRTLARAQQLNPKLWMTYAVAGHNVGFGPAGDLQSLKMYEKAENLAPYISYTHVLLGNAYGVYYTPYQSFTKSATEYNKALSLQPASVEAAWGLFDIYDVRLPNAAKAKRAKSKLESLLPLGFSLKKQASERLSKY
jgi:tetratricopeptide (TPR) repeat protein